MDKKITENAYGKINLSLDITGRMTNGLHEVKTVMQTISLCDTVTLTCVRGAKGIKISCDDKSVPCDERNTCYKVTDVFLEKTGVTGYGIEIYIQKRIPSMAGLGGGSSDAAAVIRMLNSAFETNLNCDELREIAAKVGADIPFLINGGTALCMGAGDRVSPLPEKLHYYILLVKPEFGVSTPEAYKSFDKKGIVSKLNSDKLANAIVNGESILSYISNDLEKAIDSPVISEIKAELISLGALASLMSGSGSCVYGLFDSDEMCRKAYDELKGKYSFTAVCRTI